MSKNGKPIIQLAGGVLDVRSRRLANEQGKRIIIQLEIPEMFAEHAAKISLIKGPVNIQIQEQDD